MLRTLAAAFPEEGLEHGDTFILADSTGEFTAMIQFRVLKEVHEGPSGAILRSEASEDDTLHAGVNDGAGAHRARFLGDVEFAFAQSPIFEH